VFRRGQLHHRRGLSDRRRVFESALNQTLRLQFKEQNALELIRQRIFVAVFPQGISD
jgi:hypothetical protein